MAKRKDKKEVGSVLAIRSNTYIIFAIILLLVGSTWAWFTSESTVEVEEMQSGILEVMLVDKNGNKIENTLAFVKEGDGEILWEPGATYDLEEVYVKNTGNLKLKYNLEIIGINGSEDLSKVIEWSVDGNDLNETYVLEPDEMSGKIVISGHMDETADNNYQDLSLEGISIKANATQINNNGN